MTRAEGQTLTGARYTVEEMRQIVERPFPGIGATVASRQRQPLPPIGPGESFFVSKPDEYGLSLLVFPNAPVSLDNEPLPIRICGLTNTVIHLGWGKYHQTKPQTTFVFKDCDNVVLKVGALIIHADEPKDPPPLYQTENCRRVRVYEIDTRYVGADPLQTNAVKAVSGSVR